MRRWFSAQASWVGESEDTAVGMAQCHSSTSLTRALPPLLCALNRPQCLCKLAWCCLSASSRPCQHHWNSIALFPGSWCSQKIVWLGCVCLPQVEVLSILEFRDIFLWYVCHGSSSQSERAAKEARPGKALRSAANPEPGISLLFKPFAGATHCAGFSQSLFLVCLLCTRCYSAVPGTQNTVGKKTDIVSQSRALKF